MKPVNIMMQGIINILDHFALGNRYFLVNKISFTGWKDFTIYGRIYRVASSAERILKWENTFIYII